jgi:hypothetical protein
MDLPFDSEAPKGALKEVLGNPNYKDPSIPRSVFYTLEKEKVDPIQVLAAFAKGQLSDDPAHQLSAAKELANYLHPKKKSVDVKAEAKVGVTYEVVSFKDIAPTKAKVLTDQVTYLAEGAAQRDILELIASAGPEDAEFVEVERGGS